MQFERGESASNHAFQISTLQYLILKCGVTTDCCEVAAAYCIAVVKFYLSSEGYVEGVLLFPFLLRYLNWNIENAYIRTTLNLFSRVLIWRKI